MTSKLPMLNSGKRFAGDSSSGSVMPLVRPPLAISVVHIQPCESGNLRAIATVVINGDITIHGWHVVQQTGQKAWVSVPMRMWANPGGGKRYAPLIELPRYLKDEICREILMKWRRRGI